LALLGSILKHTIRLGKKIPRPGPKNAFLQQKRTLRKLLQKAEYTAFGEHYGFSKILNEKKFLEAFRNTVPTHDYNTIFKNWWYRTLNGEAFVTWPGKVKYFALSSGTSEASSKYIPVTREMLRAIQKTSVRQVLTQSYYPFPDEHYEKGILMIGGSTHLNFNGTYFEGDLSGITTGQIPFWFQHFYKPGKRISKERDWTSKLEEIVKNAPGWDISVICGVPAWIQILIEKIIDRYKLKHIHELWPNLRVYVHGGVSLEPYKTGFEKLLGKPIVYLETYLASEGFIAYQDHPDAKGMRLVTDNGIFFEFVPFNEDNFDEDGNMLPQAKGHFLNEVEENKEYALLLSTCSGAWRYLIGDTIKFVALENQEIIITGRTKHFLSLCGEHLSQDNMNRAIRTVAEELNIDIREFTVCGIPYEKMFAHRWHIGTDDPVDPTVLKERIDYHLKILNDDYRVERIAALKDVLVYVHPSSFFYQFMEQKGKLGGQNKFPRVLKKKNLEAWEAFLKEKQIKLA
jgi:hypothetical protein